MDIVFIEQLSVITTIGVYDWEQTISQKLVFDVEMAWDNRQAAASDDFIALYHGIYLRRVRLRALLLRTN